MTRLANCIMVCGLAALAISGTTSRASAEETGTFQNRLNGATVGLPLGALPPPGLYTGLVTAYLGWPGHGTGNQAPGLYLPAVAQAVPLLYVPGWNFLGAHYSMAAVQAFYMFTVLPASPFSTPEPAVLGWGAERANTLWNPINLSWNLGSGWFVAAGFNFMAPDGIRYTGTPNPDYWTFEPYAAVSYLAQHWNLTANFFYDINTESQSVCCTGLPITSGNALYGDFHALYKVGKWSFGPVAYFEAQTTRDTGSGCVIAPDACGLLSNFAVGGLVGYDFGPVDLQVWVTDSVTRNNAIDGFDVWTRLGFRLWGPEAPKP